MKLNWHLASYQCLCCIVLALVAGCNSRSVPSDDLISRTSLDVRRTFVGSEPSDDIISRTFLDIRRRFEGSGYSFLSSAFHDQHVRGNIAHAGDVEDAALAKRLLNTWHKVWAVYFGVLGLIFSLLAFLNLRNKEGKPRAFRRQEEDDEDGSEDQFMGAESSTADPERQGKYFKMHTEELVDIMGLSGMSLLELSASSGISGLPLIQAVPFVAIQAWILQGLILFYMARRVIRMSVEGPGENRDAYEVPFTIIFAAIYLHFINCVNDLPYSLSIASHIGGLHECKSHLAIAIPTFAMDGLVVPFTSLVVGALYLCTSVSVADVILNSCAVAFISNIDNWILALNEKLNKSAGDGEGDDGGEATSVYVPVNKKLVTRMSWWMCVVPIVPTVFSGFFAYMGLVYLEL